MKKTLDFLQWATDWTINGKTQCQSDFRCHLSFFMPRAIQEPTVIWTHISIWRKHHWWDFVINSSQKQALCYHLEFRIHSNEPSTKNRPWNNNSMLELQIYFKSISESKICIFPQTNGYSTHLESRRNVSTFFYRPREEFYKIFNICILSF